MQMDWARYERGKNCSWEGPGHGSVVPDIAGTWWLVYAAWPYQGVNTDLGRAMLLDRSNTSLHV